MEWFDLSEIFLKMLLVFKHIIPYMYLSFLYKFFKTGFSRLLPSLDEQIEKYGNFNEIFGVNKSIDSMETISNLLKNTQNSHYKLVLILGP